MTKTNFTLFYSNTCQTASNQFYPNEIQISSENDLKTAVSHDHVCARYKNNHRKKEHFIHSDCTMFDIDNSDSANPSDCIYPVDVKEKFPNVCFYIVFSRNHMKIKDGKAARPKFHVYFPDRLIENSTEYQKLKNKVCAYFTAFDANAKDSARFFFGVENPQIEFQDGDIVLSDFMETVELDIQESFNKNSFPENNSIIPYGKRHSTLFDYATRVVTRWGESDKAYSAFCSEIKKCVPPMEETELISIWKSVCKHYHEKTENSPDYLPPELYELFSKAETLKPNDFTDLGQTNVFVKVFKDVVRYSTATDYLYYNGKVWVESKTKIHRFVQLLTTHQLREVSFLLTEARKEENNAIINDDVSNQEIVKGSIKNAENYRKFVMKHRQTARITAVLTEAQPMVEIDVEKLDKNGFLLNTPAGIIDLRTGAQNQHNSLDYCTKITTVSPDLQNAELFQNFLETITNHNQSLKEYLQYIAGMCLIGKVYCENLIIAYGTGKNGKSTFFNLLSMVMGNYSGNLSAEILTKNSRINKKNEFAELRGKRLVIASELEDGRQLDTASLKQLCSTDMIYAEKKYKNPFSFIPTHTTVLCTNHLPSVEALDNGTWRRLVVVPFQAVIHDSEEIKNYTEYLFQNSGGAVLSWMIQGAQKFIESDYKISQPEIVKQAIKTYRAENNWIQNYLFECCETDRAYFEKASELYNNYKDYCINTGESIKSCPAFKKAMIEAGYKHKSNAKGSFYYGVRIKQFHMPYINPPSMVEDGGEIDNFSENDLEF